MRLPRNRSEVQASATPLALVKSSVLNFVSCERIEKKFRLFYNTFLLKSKNGHSETIARTESHINPDWSYSLQKKPGKNKKRYKISFASYFKWFPSDTVR